ncbi:MAG: endonuclease/exonuclease/phosphatase family protein, partial [Actinobacteria bacterium]|nr:endonuclease/exonuclease/phosphatase family protein [Actinomycetota bacterium]
MPIPTICDAPPGTVKAQLDRLSSELRASIPPRRLDENLLIATWNIRAFGDLTPKWESSDDDSPKRDLGSVLCLAEIISRFDVVAIQEVKDNLKGLRDMMRVLGGDWGLIMTDTNEGGVGNSERMAFVFDTRRVKPSGLAGELVVPPEWRDTIGRDLTSGQFARTPYAVSFISHGQTFVLVTLHVLYGDEASERAGELRAIAEWMARWAKQEEDWGHNLIALGDFNIDRINDPNFEAFTSTGLRPPMELEGLPRTIFD